MFKKQKSKFLNPGEKVERFCPPEKLSRIIIVDEHFKILEDFGLMHTFEDDFYLNALCPQGQEEYYKKYSDVGILPLFEHRSLCWRIKISQEENQSPSGVEMNPLLFLMGLIFAFLS